LAPQVRPTGLFQRSASSTATTQRSPGVMRRVAISGSFFICIAAAASWEPRVASIRVSCSALTVIPAWRIAWPRAPRTAWSGAATVRSAWRVIEAMTG
jgi:hypothetical protein